MNKPIRTKPEPYCPRCGAKMQLKRPNSSQGWDPFWGCSQYTECKGSLNIGNDGKPEEEDFLWNGLP